MHLKDAMASLPSGQTPGSEMFPVCAPMENPINPSMQTHSLTNQMKAKYANEEKSSMNHEAESKCHCQLHNNVPKIYKPP